MEKSDLIHFHGTVVSLVRSAELAGIAQKEKSYA